MVMDISADKVITAMNREEGMFELQAKAVILAMGCRERSKGALNIPGYRPAVSILRYCTEISKYRRLHARS